MRGAGDESHRTWGQHAQSNLAGPCISQTLSDRNSRTQAEQLSRNRAEGADRGAEIEDPLGDLVKNVTTADGLVEVLRPAALVAVVVHPDSGGVDVGRPLAGEFVGHPVRCVDEVSGPAIGLRLVLTQPGRLEGIPLGGCRGGSGAVVEAGDRVRSLRASGLLRGADVHPHDGRTQLVATLVHSNHRQRRGVVGDTSDGSRGDPGSRDGTMTGRLKGLPPLLGILFGPAWTGVGGLVRGRCESQRTSFKVENCHSARLGAVVNAQEVRAVVQHRCLL